MKYLWEILVPTEFREEPGRYYKRKYHKIFDAYVLKICGGITIYPVTKGEWSSEDEDAVYSERMIPCRIFATEEEIRYICDFAAKHYNQLAIFAYVVSNKVIIRHYDHFGKDVFCKKEER